MQSHELLREVPERTSAKQVADEPRLSRSLIYKWAEPPEAGSGQARASITTSPRLVRITV